MAGFKFMDLRTATTDHAEKPSTMCIEEIKEPIQIQDIKQEQQPIAIKTNITASFDNIDDIDNINSSYLSSTALPCSTPPTYYTSMSNPTSPMTSLQKQNGPNDDRQSERLLGFSNDQFRQIKSRFTQRYSPPRGYMSLHELLIDLNKVIDILWYSFTSSQPSMSMSSHSPSPNEMSPKLNGQTHCLLDIADNLVEFVEGFALNSIDPHALFKIFHKLDKILARLLYEPSNLLLGAPEDLRLLKITQRSKLSVMKVLSITPCRDLKLTSIYEHVLRIIRQNEETQRNSLDSLA